MPPPKRFQYQDDMPYAREPLKSLYVAQRLFTTLVMTVWWTVYYGVMPRRFRPRPSWSIKCCISVNFTRRVYKVTELAGVTWGVRDPDKECDNRTLKHTQFEWVEPLPEEYRSGIIVDPQVPFKRVGCYVWPKERPKIIPACAEAKSSQSNSRDGLMDSAELEVTAGDVPLIGIFLHGGGYCHMSAHEKASTSKIPARLMKDKAFTEIHAVEYRLLQHAPFPAAVQDAAAVYAHIVHRHQRHAAKASANSQAVVQENDDDEVSGKAIKAIVDYLGVENSDFRERAKFKRENDEVHARVAEETSHLGCKIVIIGDSAGGNLVLALARWIRDEGVLPPPHGLLLLSPSCDPSHAFPETPSSYVPRPHANTDYLVDTPEPRALLQRTFLGHNPVETMHSPYVSPASMRVLTAFYGDAFASSVADLTIAQLDDEHRQYLRNMSSVPATPIPQTPVMGHDAPLIIGPPGPGAQGLTRAGRSPTSLAHPIIASPRGLGLFSEFPRVCVVLGDAERLEREVMKLVGAMERDGVEVHTVWVKDAPHDVLMMGWWDERVRDGVWAQVEDWVAKV